MVGAGSIKVITCHVHVESKILTTVSKNWQNSTWFLEYDMALWDQQITADLKAGKLEKLLTEARTDFKTGKAREL